MTAWLESVLEIEDPIFEASLANAKGLSAGADLGVLWYVWLYLAAFLAVALISYALYGRGHGPVRPWSFLRYVLPKEVYLHKSTAVDLQILIANRFITPAIFLLGAMATAFVGSKITHGLAALWPAWNPDFEWTSSEVLGFTVCLALVSDFSTYVSHALHHRVPWLWEFHKVHHSAEVLSPLTVFRKHPVYDLISKVIDVALLAPFLGLAFFLFAGPVSALSVLGANLVFGIFHLAGGSLRHSHMWLSYGPIFSRVFISPAQHQIHHSRAKRHWDKNFGEVFAIWDWVFGTLYVPERKEELVFGVDETASREHRNLFSAYAVPFRNSFRLLIGDRAATAGPGWPEHPATGAR